VVGLAAVGLAAAAFFALFDFLAVCGSVASSCAISSSANSAASCSANSCAIVFQSLQNRKINILFYRLAHTFGQHFLHFTNFCTSAASLSTASDAPEHPSLQCRHAPPSDRYPSTFKPTSPPDGIAVPRAQHASL
jgi:hypothetical protein